MIKTKNQKKKCGYHISDIPKGKLGRASKILEETLELIDAEKQGCKVMAIIELSDLVGAIEAYLAENVRGTSLKDLQIMSAITCRAFKNGHRK